MRKLILLLAVAAFVAVALPATAQGNGECIRYDVGVELYANQRPHEATVPVDIEAGEYQITVQTWDDHLIKDPLQDQDREIVRVSVGPLSWDTPEVPDDTDFAPPLMVVAELPDVSQVVFEHAYYPLGKGEPNSVTVLWIEFCQQAEPESTTTTEPEEPTTTEPEEPTTTEPEEPTTTEPEEPTTTEPEEPTETTVEDSPSTTADRPLGEGDMAEGTNSFPVSEEAVWVLAATIAFSLIALIKRQFVKN